MMEHVQSHLALAEEFNQDAKILIHNGGSPSSIASRAYYGMYHATRALLLSQNINANTHQGLVTKFSQIFIKTEVFDRKYGKILANGLRQRLIGDYEIGFGIDLYHANELYVQASEFINLAKQYLSKIM